MNQHSALLALADGTLFYGRSIGVTGTSVGEIVFNTSMTGYQEIITDASYAQQFITFTLPHIGNVGCNSDDRESEKVWAAGVIVRDSSLIASNWRATQTLGEFLSQHNVIAIADLDTRHLTQLIRETGAQKACLTTDVLNPDLAIAKAREFAGLEGLDLAKVVSTASPYTLEQNDALYHVVVYDFGVKQNILRLLTERRCRLTVVPATTSAAEVLALQPHGVVLSNGPGDPAACDYAINNTVYFLEQDIPLLGICLGFQLLALACGGESEKMKFGHHGGNHPVKDEMSGRVIITSQNHGFMIKEQSLPPELMVTHRSLFDGSLQGIKHQTKSAIGFQGHPEASPGPQEAAYLFDQFIHLMHNRITINQPHSQEPCLNAAI